MGRLSRVRAAYDRYGLVGLARQAAGRPRRLYEIARGTTRHFYALEHPVYWEDIVTVVPRAVECSRDEAVAAWEELREDARFERELTAGLNRTTERPSGLHSNWREFLYVIVRLTEPAFVVETGVYDGLSAAYILAAIRANGHGQLLSVDINDRSRLPSDLGAVDAGWLVPTYLREPWTRRFGDAENLLPEVVDEHPPDLFLHDSLHTAEHMRFEFDTAIDAMDSGGLVATDNSRFNDVFKSIAESSLREVAFWRNTEYALSPSKERVDDRFGVGVLE